MDVDKASKEQRALKQKVEVLERENMLLKKSLFELSTRYNSLAHKLQPFSLGDILDSALDVGINSLLEGVDSNDTSSIGMGGSSLSGGPGQILPANAGSSGPGANVASIGSGIGGVSPGSINTVPGINASTGQAGNGSIPINSSSNGGSMVTNNGISNANNVGASGLGNTNNGGGGGGSVGGNASDTNTNERFGAGRDKISSKDNRHFYLRQELKGHTGAVYAVQFSPNGRFVSSGSFDKTVRIWDPLGSQKEIHILRGHTLNVSDLSWSSDSAELLSGAYDQTCKTWDVEGGKMIESYASEGFVQCVMFSPKDKNIFFSGTSRNILCVTDRRDPNVAITLRNDSMVNSLIVTKDGQHVMSGDAAGCIRTWDIRTGKSILNESTRKPISHITCCPTLVSEDEPRYLAANSYDNVIRVYDRGFASPIGPYKLMHTLKGYKNKNWPIKSAFFKVRGGTSLRGTSTDDLFSTSDPQTQDTTTGSDKTTSMDTLLATGSADPFVYVYSLGATEGSSELYQRLEGHTDRVYAVTFHPTDLMLCSCSADFTLKFWYTNKNKRK